MTDKEKNGEQIIMSDTHDNELMMEAYDVLKFRDGATYIGDQKLNNEDFIYVHSQDWFITDSLCWLEADCVGAGVLMIGQHVIDSENEAKVRKMKIGDIVYLDSELCPWDQFDIYSKDRELLVKGVRL
jgi:hypothetical protein